MDFGHLSPWIQRDPRHPAVARGHLRRRVVAAGQAQSAGPGLALLDRGKIGILLDTHGILLNNNGILYIYIYIYIPG